MFRIRAIMLDTGMQPYTDVADLFVIDPDGFMIRYNIFLNQLVGSIYIIT